MKKSIDLMGERSFDNAVAHGEKMLDELDTIFEDNGWNTEKVAQGVIVESIPIRGDFEASKILLMRSKGRINRCAKSVFNLLVSPEGYAILDPVSDEEDHKKPLVASYDWKEGGRLEIATANVNIPFMPKTEFLVLNVIDSDRMVFVSKSIIHPDYPGSSIYYQGKEDYSKNIPDAKIRAINTMGIEVRAVEEDVCELLVFNYVDMCLKKGQTPWLFNQINKNFFPKLYKRIEKYFSTVSGFVE